MSGSVGAQVEIEKEQATSDDRFAHAHARAIARTRTRTGSLAQACARTHGHTCSVTYCAIVHSLYVAPVDQRRLL